MEMKSAISTVFLSTKLHRFPFSCSPHISFCHRTSTNAARIPTSLRPLDHNQRGKLLNLRRICTSFTPVMASSFKPEQARAPPALPLPSPPVTKFNIGLCQLAVTADKQLNIEHARFPLYAEDIDAGGDASPSTAMLSEVARRLNITIVGGSIPERSGDRLYNTCCVFETHGKLLAKHRKDVPAIVEAAAR
ncbi:Omega-amidase, chloroplastic [Linum perenne]